MTRVKICGITNREDAKCCADCGADAIGFVFADSPRRVTPTQARDIMSRLEPFVTGVGVFVDEPAEEVRRTLEMTGCSVAQLHGDEPPTYIESLAPYGVVKAIRVDGSLDDALLNGYKGARAVLLDTYVPGLAGGTGRRSDTRLAAKLAREGWRVIVAGGLTAANVAEVVASVRPYGVDVSSGVESAPGRKDHGQVARFIAAVRAADRAGG